MAHSMPPESDPIIRSLRDSGLRPLPPRGSRSDRRPPFIIGGIVLLVVLLFLIPAITARLADWLWYSEIGFDRVFL
ncbi:MAG TPA: hypothetical protein VIP11_18535, partial [Gemmatimonadaceae bacterium]